MKPDDPVKSRKTVKPGMTVRGFPVFGEPGKPVRPAFCLFTILLFSLLIVPGKLCALDSSADALAQRQRQLEERLQRLEARLEGQSAQTDTSAAAKPTIDDRLREDVAEMSDRLDVIETKSILDKIKLGGEFRTRYESVRFHHHTFNGVPGNGATDEVWSNRLRLSMRSDIRDNIIFHGRLSYFKLWGEFTYDGNSSDWNYPSIPDQEGDLHVERAYIDYFLPDTPISLTFGRMPTSDGPPNELKDNTTRKSTWPVLMNDVEADGIIATTALDRWTRLPDSFFRIAYTKFQQHYLRYQGSTRNFDDVRVWGASFETALPGMPPSLLWLSYGRMDLAPLKNLPGILSYPKDVGYTDICTFHLQFNNLFQAGLDWFGAYTYLYSDTKPRGTLFDNGYEAGIYTDNVHGTLGKNLKGHGVYTGFRYQLPIQFLKHPRMGVEYNYGSKYWMGLLSSGSGNLVNKLDVHGNAYEVYYIQPIHRKTMFARLGYVLMDHQYFNPLYGEPVQSDMRTENLYLLVNVRF